MYLSEDQTLTLTPKLFNRALGLGATSAQAYKAVAAQLLPNIHALLNKASHHGSDLAQTRNTKEVPIPKRSATTHDAR